VSARREKRLRALERRVSERLPEPGPAPAFSVETAHRGLWQRLVDIFRKDD